MVHTPESDAWLSYREQGGILAYNSYRKVLEGLVLTSPTPVGSAAVDTLCAKLKLPFTRQLLCAMSYISANQDALCLPSGVTLEQEPGVRLVYEAALIIKDKEIVETIRERYKALAQPTKSRL